MTRNRELGTMVLLADVQEQPRRALARSEVMEEVGEEHVLASVGEALLVAREHVEALEALADR